MDFQVRAHSITLTEDTRDYARKKIGKAVQKILGNAAAKVDVEISNLDHGKGAPMSRVKVVVFVPHAKSVSVQVDDESVPAGIDLASDKIWRALKRLRQRRRYLSRSGDGGVTTVEAENDGDAEPEDNAAIAAERLPIAPLPG